MEELIGSVAGGGLLGLFGSIADRVMAIFERREARRDRLIQNEHELRLIQEQRQTSQLETEQDLALIQSAGSYRGLEASLEHDSKIDDVSPWVNNVRALVRPTLTATALLAMIAMTWTLGANYQMTLVESVVFVATTATVWWFGDRAKSRSPMTGLPR